MENGNGQPTGQYEKITPAKAQLWLNSTYEYQRPVRQWWVNYLAREMKLGRFLPLSTIHFVFYGGKSHLINGQHTLRAIIESGTTQTLLVARTSVKTDEELAQYYFRFDQSIKRTFSDAIGALHLSEIAHTSMDKLNKLSSAVIWIGMDFGAGKKKLGARIPVDDLVRETITWADDFAKLEDAMTPCSSEIRKAIIRRAVLSVAVVTFRNKPSHALDFWRQVARDDGLKYGDPRKTLNKWLLTNTVSGGGKEGMAPAMMSRGIERAWNAFYEGRTLQTIIVKKQYAEIDLKGCAIPEVFADLKGL